MGEGIDAIVVPISNAKTLAQGKHAMVAKLTKEVSWSNSEIEPILSPESQVHQQNLLAYKAFKY